ncbi:uncharacterized protein LOC143299139 [Babylonia areolata]|uniref:uncharacterized protein LOC143299139 n=1 Tax=Babylonia areolata TaxID=304850 RepID=UPI003FD0F079
MATTSATTTTSPAAATVAVTEDGGSSVPSPYAWSGAYMPQMPGAMHLPHRPAHMGLDDWGQQYFEAAAAAATSSSGQPVMPNGGTPPPHPHPFHPSYSANYHHHPYRIHPGGMDGMYPPPQGMVMESGSSSGESCSPPGGAGPGCSGGTGTKQLRPPYEWMKPANLQPAPGKTRTKDKYRVVYSDHQRLELEKEFHFHNYITLRRKSEISQQLGLSERQVKIWFQNRRAKKRKQNKKQAEILASAGIPRASVPGVNPPQAAANILHQGQANSGGLPKMEPRDSPPQQPRPQGHAQSPPNMGMNVNPLHMYGQSGPVVNNNGMPHDASVSSMAQQVYVPQRVSPASSAPGLMAENHALSQMANPVASAHHSDPACSGAPVQSQSVLSSPFEKKQEPL